MFYATTGKRRKIYVNVRMYLAQLIRNFRPNPILTWAGGDSLPAGSERRASARRTARQLQSEHVSTAFEIPCSARALRRVVALPAAVSLLGDSAGAKSRGPRGS